MTGYQNKLQAETDVDCAWCDRTVVCHRASRGTGLRRHFEMPAAAHHNKSSGATKNDQLVNARASRDDNRFPRPT